jgi:hypothetical protein
LFVVDTQQTFRTIENEVWHDRQRLFRRINEGSEGSD